MRELLIKIENWVLDDESAVLGVGKFLLLVGVFVFVVLFTIVTIANWINPHQRVVLDLTTTWDCTATHREMQYVRHGKIHRWEEVTICDTYQRRAP